MLRLFRQFRRDHAAGGGALQFVQRALQKGSRVAGVQQGILHKTAESEICNGRKFDQHGLYSFSNFKTCFFCFAPFVAAMWST